MHGVATAQAARATGGATLTWRTLGLDAMASMLVVSLRRLGRTGFAAECQWPRLHPLNDRAVAVAHHPLLMVESTRQIAVALERLHLSAEGPALLEPVSVSLGLRSRSWPSERGSATDVTVRVSVSDHATPAPGLTGYRITAEYEHAGTPFGSCTMRMARPAPAGPPCAPAAAPLPALLHPPAAVVGAAADTDVMLARAPQGRLAIMPRDPAHPVLLAGRPARLPAAAVLEAARQATLLNCGMTTAAVAGLRVELLAPVPSRGALVEVAAEPGGARVIVTASGRVAALCTVALLRA
ncbi:hypothetical protein [Streptomyces sp. NPDC046925]|uniref:AfsA-related hotdog domain-containing protein n=1 Tax=Streptomyces sp. NPDC046925 TaxID=3155375 RepID=UPI0033E10571